MSFIQRNDDEVLDRAVAQVAGEPIDPAEAERAAARVWERLTREGAVGIATGEPAAATLPSSLRGCEDFQALLPAYLRGELPPARALLVEDHTRGCVPCRRALREAREGRPAAVSTAAALAPRRPRALALGLAAALVAGLGLGVLLLLQEMWAGGGRMARVESIEGNLYRVHGAASEPVGAGTPLAEGEEVRTAKGSRALVRMTDGSLIEMSERAGIALEAGRAGNTIHLGRGRIIVQAAKQRPRHLYVATGDCLVSVTGTIFSVNHGTKGSRVSVIEGEVRVRQAKRDSILHPGDQVTTHPTVAAVPVRREIAWSQDAGRYEALLAELTAAGRAIDEAVERPGLRTSTRLLDLVPAGTTVYVALPNLARSLGETQRLLDERIRDSEVLRQWWSDTLGSSENEARFHDMIEEIRDLGEDLGDEVVVAFDAGQDGDHQPVLLAEVTDEAAFRAALEAEVAKVNARTGRTVLTIVADPLAAAGTERSEGLLLWVGHGIFAGSPSGARLAQVAAVAGGAENPFTASSFHDRIAEAYQDGAGWLFSADLARLVREHGRDRDGAPESAERSAEALGILDLENFIVDRREVGGATETRASLTFDQPRRGIAAWLAEPAPMGALEFVSPDANLVAAFVVKSPVSLVDDLLATSPEFAAELAELKAKQGFDLREDVAAPLGGEIALAMDGPVLPQPSWKLVAEVYDPARLQHTLMTAVARLDDALRRDGKPGIAIAEESAGGRTWYAVRSASHLEVHYLFEDGYLVAAPSRALLDSSRPPRAAGVTIATSPRFRDLLGADGQVNVSAVVYQNLAPLAEAGAKLLPSGATGREGGPGAFARLLVGQGPTLLYAYAGSDRIQFGSRGEAGPLGQNLSTLAGFGGILGVMGSGREMAEEAR